MKTIGIIAAMDEEIQHIKQNMDIKVVKQAVGMDFCIGIYEGKNIVAVRSGIGKVNAAICTQVLIDLFAADYIINIGAAGAIQNDLKVGDIVISKDTVQHDMDTSALGDAIGVIPRMNESFFEADEVLVKIATEEGKALDLSNKVVIGRIASGDQFVASAERKHFIWDTFKAYCTEMEGAAVAQVCALNKIPFVIIRAISDNADGEAGPTYETFVKTAAQNTSKLVEKIINRC